MAPTLARLSCPTGASGTNGLARPTHARTAGRTLCRMNGDLSPTPTRPATCKGGAQHETRQTLGGMGRAALQHARKEAPFGAQRIARNPHNRWRLVSANFHRKNRPHSHGLARPAMEKMRPSIPLGWEGSPIHFSILSPGVEGVARPFLMLPATNSIWSQAMCRFAQAPIISKPVHPPDAC